MHRFAVLLLTVTALALLAGGCGSRPEPTPVERKFINERKVLMPPGKAAKAK